MLKKIKKAMEFEGRILYYEQPIKYFNGNGYECQNQYRINICEPEISKDLAKCGCGKGKTYKLFFPDISILKKHMYRHFYKRVDRW